MVLGRQVLSYTIVVFSFLFSPILYCMDGEINQLLVWEKILVDGVSHVGHHTICASAQVSHGYNKKIRETAGNRENYLAQCIKKSEKACFMSQSKLRYHPYGSACATGTIFLPGIKKISTLTLRYACLEDESINYQTNEWDQFRSELVHQPPLIFKKDGVVFYGCRERSFDVVEYSLDTNGVAKALKCIMKIDNSCKWYPLNWFVSFPVLLKAFLDSVGQQSFGEGCNYKIYNIKHVTIPDVYKTSMRLDDSPRYQFDELPDAIKDAVNRRYAAQKDKNCQQQ